jgi:hypothetical protein
MTTPHVTETLLPLEPTTRDPFIEPDEPTSLSQHDRDKGSWGAHESTVEMPEPFTGVC